MPLPEGYLPREGDELLIHATVRYDVDLNDTSVHVKAGHHSFIVQTAHVHALHCRKWNPKDRVRETKPQVCPSDEHPCGVVIATYGTKVWVRLDREPGKKVFNDGLVTYEANDLEAEPEYPEPDAAYRNRILDEGIDADLEATEINRATGLELDKFGDKFGVIRKGIK